MKIIIKAKLCFSKGENEVGFKLAHAYNLQKIARTSLVSNSYEANVKSNFISAAQAFEACSRPIQAASCYKVFLSDIWKSFSFVNYSQYMTYKYPGHWRE
jgi:hypothetical protein